MQGSEHSSLGKKMQFKESRENQKPLHGLPNDDILRAVDKGFQLQRLVSISSALVTWMAQYEALGRVSPSTWRHFMLFYF